MGMKEDEIDCLVDPMEGQQIWSISRIGIWGKMLDFDRIYQLGSHLLDKDTIDILGELDEELTYHVFIPPAR